jgi:toxin ParE1/3/4
LPQIKRWPQLLPSGPMRIRWLRTALRNLNELAQYIAKDNPRAAVQMVRRIKTAAQQLQKYPALGRLGRVTDTRELIIPGTTYLIPYRIKGDELHILRVFHGSQDWPEDGS